MRVNTSTDAWLAEQLGITEDELRQRGSRRDDSTIDLHATLRTMPFVGPLAGAVVRKYRITYTLVVALPHVRVWVARAEWDRAFRSRRGPVFYERFHGGAWKHLDAGALPAEFARDINLAVLAAIGRRGEAA